MDQFRAIADPAIQDSWVRDKAIQPRRRRIGHPGFAWLARRSATVSLAWLIMVAMGPDPALAHAGERAFVLLLPTGYYLLGGTLAVAATFLALVFVPPRIVSGLFMTRPTMLALPAPNPLWFNLPALITGVGLLAAGWLGPRDPMENALPTAFWTMGWVGLTLAHAVFGNLWGLFNPLRGADWLVGRGLARLGMRGQPALPYPDWLGYWPASAGLLCFAWFELAYPAPEDPDLLANAILFYVAINLAAMRVLGAEAWLERGEAFSVFFRLVAGLAPIQTKCHPGDPGRATLRLMMPGARLMESAPCRPDFALFVLLALGSVSFDGLSKTFWWLDLAGVNPLEFPGRSAMVGWNSFGLIATVLGLTLLYLLTQVLGRRVAPRTPPGWPFAAVLSLAPISLGFHFAHYLTAFMVNVQYAFLALSDPLGRQWDLLGLGHRRVTTSFLYNQRDVTLIWNAQALAIVLGHILAVVMAVALSRSPDGRTEGNWVAEAPLATLMIFYTLFGLWLLSTPVAG